MVYYDANVVVTNLLPEDEIPVSIFGKLSNRRVSPRPCTVQQPYTDPVFLGWFYVRYKGGSGAFYHYSELCPVEFSPSGPAASFSAVFDFYPYGTPVRCVRLDVTTGFPHEYCPERQAGMAGTSRGLIRPGSDCYAVQVPGFERPVLFLASELVPASVPTDRRAGRAVEVD
jgi:hypothetical protein